MSEHSIARHQVRRPATSRDLIGPPVAAVLIVAIAGLVAAAATPEDARAPVALCAGVAALLVGVAAAVAARNQQAARELRNRVNALDARVSQQAAQAEQLADETLPAVVRRLRDGESVQAALGEAPRTADPSHQRIMRTLAEEVGRGERMRAAAMAACANAAGRVQALSTSMLADLREMEGRHNEEVLGDLLRLDHSTAQAGRLADSIAILTGGRSGRRWTKPIVMESILRGAMGRISAYQRVRLHSVSTVAIVGYAAEGVMHALAELMDNATTFSPPSEEVHVYVEEVQAGVIITIEDGGLVMGPAALARAERAVSAQTLDLTTLSGTRLGLAVVGVLARKHNLTVSFRPSSRGGTGVVVMVPRQLLTQPRQDVPRDEPPTEASPVGDALSLAVATPGRALGPGEARQLNGAPSDPVEAPTDADADAAGGVPGLPKRPRGQTLAASTRPSAEPAAPGAPAPHRRNTGARFGAFREATTRGRRGTTGPVAPAAPPGLPGPPGPAGPAGAIENTDR